VNVKARLVKQVLFKVYYKILTFFTRRCGIDVFAEALLRIPDTATRDLLIRDKINQGNWKEHVGQSNLMFVNAAAWGLMLTGKLMETPNKPVYQVF
jgi:hypothetical protein